MLSYANQTVTDHVTGSRLPVCPSGPEQREHVVAAQLHSVLRHAQDG